MSERIKFTTETGCEYTRTRLRPVGMSVAVRGWDHSRTLYHPTEDDAEWFPGVQYRVETTANRDQEDPLFCTLPVRIKKGTHSVFEIFSHDGSIATTIRVSKFFIW